MIKKLLSISRRALLIGIAIIIGLGGAGLIILSSHGSNKNSKAEYPEYLNFGGKYVFTVPKSYSVDEQSVPGAELIYTGTLSAKTLDDVYNANGIAVQAVSELTDHSAKAFKDYVNKTFLPDIKKNLSTTDAKAKFSKSNGSDVASITVNKDGQALRSIFVKGGQHPVTVVSKTESDTFKKIKTTIKDAENSDLKDEVDPLSKAVQNNLQLVKAQKAQEFYNGSAQELRSQNTVDQLVAAFKKSTTFLNQNITVAGGSYSPNEFSSALRFTSLDKDSPKTNFGSITLKKVDGTWKTESLTLPTP